MSVYENVTVILKKKAGGKGSGDILAFLRIVVIVQGSKVGPPNNGVDMPGHVSRGHDRIQSRSRQESVRDDKESVMSDQQWTIIPREGLWDGSRARTKDSHVLGEVIVCSGAQAVVGRGVHGESTASEHQAGQEGGRPHRGGRVLL